jgi:hypothetical protein
MVSRPVSIAALALVLAGSASLWLHAAQTPARERAGSQIPIDADDIAGVVKSARGPEAGVWGIAETTDTPTALKKVAVTDDQGRFLIPDLPARRNTVYKVWVRGYGLVDSSPVQSRPGRRLALEALVAPDASIAARIYPANYWFGLIEIPPEGNFPGTGPAGNGIGTRMLTQHQWINEMKAGCSACHQLGIKALREIPPALGTFASTFDAWERRIQVGQDAPSMTTEIDNMGRKRALELFARWTDRIAAGALPPVPPRPQGLERNLVLTMWDWGGPATFAHDELTTDKRNPTANANGPIYGVDWGNDGFLTIDPLEHTATEVRMRPRDPNTPTGKPQSMPYPSPYWGDKLYWFDQVIPNHAAMDGKGRIWMSARFRKPDDQPAFCNDHPSAALAPQPTSFRQVQYYDPRTREFKQVNICFDTHHVQFASDADETLYGNGPFSRAVGWVKTRVLDETGDERAAQGWCRPWYDVNGDGKIDPAADRLIPIGLLYSVIPHPDGSVWAASPEPMPGKLVRIDPHTCVSEAYEPPFDPASGPVGYTPRGIDVDSNGVIWTALASSGHLASFDRRKCSVPTGPAAMDGQRCGEGWTLYPVPGPRFAGVRGDVAVDFQYYNFVDRFNTLGLGTDVPVATGSTSDSLLALGPDGKWVVLRVPYPLGFFARGLDGRIDDPRGGWKGRALYADYGENAIWHVEGGLGTRSKVVKFQIRPNPLAK